MSIINLTNEELVAETRRLGIVTKPTRRAIAALAGVAKGRPSIPDVYRFAKAAKARVQPVAAAFGFLRSARYRRPRAWIDAKRYSSEAGVVPEGDSETAACFLHYRVRGGRVACRLQR